MLEVQKSVAVSEFGRLPEEGSHEFAQRQGQFLCTLNPKMLARFQEVSAELEAVERKMREVDFDGLYRAHLKARVEKSELYQSLLNKRTFSL
jgi:hypothetical protein